MLPKVCYKGIARSTIKLFLASTYTLHPTSQLFGTLLFIWADKLSFATIAKCPPGVARHERGWLFIIDTGKGFKNRIFVPYKFSVVPLWEARDSAWDTIQWKVFLWENGSFNVVYLRISTFGLCLTHIPRPPARSAGPGAAASTLREAPFCPNSGKGTPSCMENH